MLTSGPTRNEHFFLNQLKSSRYLHRLEAMPKRTREDTPSTPSSPCLTSDTASPLSSNDPVHSSKYIQTFGPGPARAVMKCSLPPHELIEFSTFDEFEIHYAKVHAYRCSECRNNFPSEHFLHLHISENHDPLIEAKRAKGDKTVCPSMSYFIVQNSLMSDSTNVLLKAVTKSALLHKRDVCISQTSICSQEQVNICPLLVLL